MARGRKANADAKLSIRMRTTEEIVDIVFQKIAAAGIDSVAEWNTLLNDTSKFDPGEKKIIKLLFQVDED